MKNSLGIFQSTKGILILLVIVWHTDNLFEVVSGLSFQMNPLIGLLVLLRNFGIYAGMPAFFMISGYGFRKRPLRIWARFNLIPMIKGYLIAAAIVIGFTALKGILLGRDVSKAMISQCIGYALMNHPKAEFFGQEVKGINVMWFVCTLAIASVMLNQILTVKNRRIQIAICIVLACTGVLLRDIRLPFCIHQSFICCSFMYIGYYMRQEKLLTKKLPWYFAALPVLLCLFASLTNDLVLKIARNVYPNGLLDLMISWIAGIVAMFFFARLDQFNGKIMDAFRWVGQYSFIIYCTHHVERQIVPWVRIVSPVIHSAPLQFAAIYILRVLLCLTAAYVFTRYKKRLLRM